MSMNSPDEIVIDRSLVADLFIAEPSRQGLEDLLFAFCKFIWWVAGGARQTL